MPFEKGRKKTGGRKTGTPNKAVKELREQLTGIVETTLAELPEILTVMEPTDRARFLIALLPYVMPKLNSVELRTEQQDEQQKKGLPEWLNAARPLTTSLIAN